MQNSPGEPSPETDEGEKLSKFRLVANSSGQFIAETSKLWLDSLLYQPKDPPFKFDADFNDELKKVIQLIVAVLIISGVLVGGVDLLSAKFDPTQTFASTIIIFIVAIFFALIYTPVFYVFGVRKCPKDATGEEKEKPKPLSIGQVFYSILYIFVPWIPILAFITATVTVAEKKILIDFLLIAPFLCGAYMFYRLAKSIKLITNCSWFRIWLSLSAPLLLVFLYLVI